MKKFLSNLQNISFLIKPIWKHGKVYLLVCIFTALFLAPIHSVAGVLFTQSVVDAVAAGRTFQDVLLIIGKFLFTLLIISILQNAFDVLYKNPVSEKIILKINSDIYQKVKETDYEYFDNPEFYDNYSWTINEYAGKSNEANTLFQDICRSISTIASMTAIIAITGPWLIAITIIEMCISIYFEKKRNRLHMKKSEEILILDRKINYVHRVYYQKEYAADIRSTKLSAYLSAMYNENGALKITTIKKYAKSILLWLYAQNFIGIIYNAAIMAYISYNMIVSKKIAGIGKFMSLINANSQLLTSLYSFFGFIARADNLSLFSKKIKAFFQTESKIEVRTAIQDFDQQIDMPFKVDLCNLDFSYANSNFKLEDITMSVLPGETAAIVGLNGAGKTTIVKLLLNLYDADKGDIKINGRSIKEFNIHMLRNKIGVAFQSTNIYAMPYIDNIGLYHSTSTDIAEALTDQFGLRDIFIKSKADFNTVLTKEFDVNGIMLSGGESQKVGLARVMSSDFGLLLLDEPSSALDPIAEYEFMKLLEGVKKKTTTIIIAHRLSAVRNVDRIYVMNDGRIAEDGTHDELISKRGLYYDMFTKQAKNYIL